MKNLTEIPEWMQLKKAMLNLGYELPGPVHDSVIMIFNTCANALSSELASPTATLYEKQEQLREQHDIHIVIDRESLDSDEMCYVYEVTYLKPEDEGSKHWVTELTRVRSFGGAGITYWGGWNSYEEALTEAIKFAETLIA